MRNSRASATGSGAAGGIRTSRGPVLGCPSRGRCWLPGAGRSRTAAMSRTGSWRPFPCPAVALRFDLAVVAAVALVEGDRVGVDLRAHVDQLGGVDVAA